MSVASKRISNLSKPWRTILLIVELLISDSAQVIIGNKVQDILCTLCIPSWQGDPYQQHQNSADRRYQPIKRASNRVLDRTGAPDYSRLFCLEYVCLLLNHAYNDNIQGVPLQHLNGHTPKIRVLLRFNFWQKVYYKKVDSHFPSDSVEAFGHIVGISDHCDDALTHKAFNPSTQKDKFFNPSTQKVIHHSLIRPADTSDPNLCVESLGGESEAAITSVIHSRHDDMLQDSKQTRTQDSAESTVPPIINPEELIGRTLLLDKQDDGQQFCARIVKLIDDHISQLENDKDRMKDLLSLDEDSREEVITYNQLLDYLARDNDNDIVWKFK
jgi:hypothetical protein